MRKQQITLKKPKTFTKKKKIALIAVLVVILIAGGGVLAWSKHRNTASSDSDNTKNSGNSTKIRPQNSVDYSPATNTDNTATDKEKSNPTDNGTIDNNESSGPTAGNFTVTITGANADSTNKLVRVSSLVNGIAEGTCTVSFTKSGQSTVTATNQVALITNSYACPNFAIPYDQFSAGGEWTVSLKVVSNNKQVTAQWAGGPITINK